MINPTEAIAHLRELVEIQQADDCDMSGYLMSVRVIEDALNKNQAEQAGSGEEVAKNGITLNALSLREAAYWANPDKTPGEDETEVRIEWMPERTSTDGEHMAAGYYLYYIDCPEEGVIGPLGEDPVPDEARLRTPHPSASMPEGYTPVRTLVLYWLLGETEAFEPLDGERGQFWWRKRLREAMLPADTTPQPADKPAPWRLAMKRLVFAARTSGGTAGADEELQNACSACESLMNDYPQEGPDHG